MNFQSYKSNSKPGVKFPKPSQKSKVTSSEGRNNVQNLNPWLVNKGKKYQSRSYIEEQIRDSYEITRVIHHEEVIHHENLYRNHKKGIKAKPNFQPVSP